MYSLSKQDFIQVVKNTPLISIDLIIENQEGEILLGWRNNQPAKGYWFVPGGRIQKDEHFEKAFERITYAETGCNYSLDDAVFLGVYEHMYPGDNFSGDPGFSTHYVVMAYRIKLDKIPENMPKEQHAEYWWANLDDILDDPNIHINTKNYFNGHPPFTD